MLKSINHLIKIYIYFDYTGCKFLSQTPITLLSQIILTMKLHHYFLITLLVFSSCSGLSYQQILSSREQILKTKGGFDSYLALEYLGFSKRLQTVNDLKASEYFAKKGIEIANGKPFVPENPLNWKADKSRIEELVFMQKKLEILLGNQSLIFQMPIQMAHLSYLYDCWASKESKAIFMADELSHCRVSFTKLIDEIDFYLEEITKDKSPSVKITIPEFTRFEILFDTDSYILSDKATKSMVEVIDFLQEQRGQFRILITANPDNSLNISRNQTLIKNRLAVVKNYLIKNDIIQNIIDERIETEDFPDIIINDEITNHLNRAVGIYVIKGDADFKPYPLPLLQNILYKDQVEKARQERGLKN